jgi:hypothetical protein
MRKTHKIDCRLPSHKSKFFTPAPPLEEVTAVSNIDKTYRQPADAWMFLRATVTTDAPFAGLAPVAGQKSVRNTGDVTGIFAGTSAWSPPT